MKTFLFLCASIIFALPSIISAQNTTGFSDPDNLQPLLDYRLPDWGYSTLSLDFSFNGNSFRELNRSVTPERQLNNRNSSLSLGPRYNLFRESEQRNYYLNANVILNYDHFYSRIDQSGFNENLEKNLNTRILLNGSNREYFRDNLFLYVNEAVTLDYNYEKNESDSNDQPIEEDISHVRTFSSETIFGVGLGRIRNVNPVIRSLRLRERAQVLNQGININRNDIRNMADQFARYDGYRARYDRPAKFFWNDLNEDLSFDLNSLNPFDLLYLTDVLDEAIGSRRQGWEAIAGGRFDYSNRLSRTEVVPGTVQRDLMINKTAGFFLEGRWFENISLRHQLGLTGNVVQMFPLGSESTVNSLQHLNLSFNWLWNITDRFLAQTGVTNMYSRIKREQDIRSWSNISSIHIDMNYFIENRFSLIFRPIFLVTYDGNNQSDTAFNSRTTSLSLSVGLRYYFSRTLK